MAELLCVLHSLSPLQTRGYVTDEILHIEPEEGIEKLQEAIKVCLSYKSSFSERRGTLATYFKDPEVPLVEWSFQPSLVFSKLDRFLEQLDVIDVRLLHCACMCSSCKHLKHGRYKRTRICFSVFQLAALREFEHDLVHDLVYGVTMRKSRQHVLLSI